MSLLSVERWKLKSDGDADAARAAAARYAEHYKRECVSDPLAFWLQDRQDPSWVVHAAVFEQARDLEAELRSPARSKLTARMMEEVVRDACPALQVFDVDTEAGQVEKEIQLLEDTDQVAVIQDVLMSGGMPQGMNAMRAFVESLDQEPRPIVASIVACERNDARHCLALHVFDSLQSMEAVRDGPAMGRLVERLLPEVEDPDGFTAGTYDVLLCTGGILAVDESRKKPSGLDMESSASL